MKETELQQDLSWNLQQERNSQLLEQSHCLKSKVHSNVLPFRLHPEAGKSLNSEELLQLEALSKTAASVAIRSLESLAKIGELDHLGGGLGLIPALMMTLGLVDDKNVRYTIEHAHTSVGYYSALATLGFLEESEVIETFRRSIDIPGHCSWVPGGTELNGGRLGVMIPAAVGQSLGMRAHLGEDAWVLCHTGDAGWISGQALNGFNAADLHDAPVTFVMHRDGINLSGPARSIIHRDPRVPISALGVEILEVSSLMDFNALYSAYGEARSLAKQGRPSLIYPVGIESNSERRVDLNLFGERYGILAEVKELAQANNIALDTEIFIPGSLMSYRDVIPMIEGVFLVNGLAGGKCHHDGHMKGRDAQKVLSHSLMAKTEEETKALEELQKADARVVVTEARPASGFENLLLDSKDIEDVVLPSVGKWASARAGSEAAYAALAQKYSKQMFVASCDLDVSTKLAKAVSYLPENHHFELGIEEQIAAIMVNGLSVSSAEPQLNVFSTFAAFFEGIAREGFEMWRYQRNLNGVNEGLNSIFHLSHVGACTGRDHFSGWSLDWINLAIGYLPYLHRFYAPADAGSAFLSVRDAGAHYGGHIVAIPRDNLPVLEKQEGGALYTKDQEWEDVTALRVHEGAKKAVLVIGAPAWLAAEASDQLLVENDLVDVHIVNALPLTQIELPVLLQKYSDGIVTVEDGLIGDVSSGRRGFAGLVCRAAEQNPVPLAHVGITDPTIAPADGHMETWEHFGITKEAIVQSLQNL